MQIPDDEARDDDTVDNDPIDNDPIDNDPIDDHTMRAAIDRLWNPGMDHRRTATAEKER